MHVRYCREQLEQTIRSLRLGCEGAAGEWLTDFIDCFTRQLTEQRIQVDGAMLNQLLNIIIQAQGRGDALLIADLLEYEIAPMLN